MSNELGIGNKITGTASKDAIHIAVVPLKAYSKMYPGDSFVLLENGSNVAVPVIKNNNEAIGIVDPFLQTTVEEGESFWGFIKPGTVTGMRHEWQHPAFGGIVKTDIKVDITESEEWIQMFCDQWNFDYDTLIQEAINGGYIVADGIDLHCAYELGEDHDLFWKHLEIVTGKKFNNEHRENFRWSCSC